MFRPRGAAGWPRQTTRTDPGDTTMASNPDDVRYTEKHQWVRADGKLVTFGVTQARVDAIGAVRFVELPYPGELYKPGEAMGRVSGETTSAPIYMPFVGQINAINKALDGEPARISNEPYGEGWILRIEPGDMGVLDELMDAEAYEAFVASSAE
jgi:glycine cleavage system H protein